MLFISTSVFSHNSKELQLLSPIFHFSIHSHDCGTAGIPHCSTYTAAGNEPALSAKKKQGKNRKIFVLMTMLKTPPKTTAHSQLLGFAFPEYPTWLKTHWKSRSPSLAIPGDVPGIKPYLKNPTWGSISSTSKLNFLLMKKWFIWGMMTHLLSMTESVFKEKSFLKFRSWDAEKKKQNTKPNPKPVVCFVASISWYTHHYPSASLGLLSGIMLPRRALPTALAIFFLF